MASLVETVTGVVPADQLGTTLIHEHLIVSDPELDRSLPHPEWNEARVAGQLRDQLQHLASLGVETIVDLTVPGLGRDVQRIAELTEDSPVRIVASTGYYTTDVLPPFFQHNGPGRLVPGPDPLAELFLNDLTVGIAGTSIRAGMIKAASGARGISGDVAAVFSRITPPAWRAANAPSWRMDHLHTTILPQLRTAGVDSSLEHQLMVLNPRRVLAGT